MAAPSGSPSARKAAQARELIADRDNHLFERGVGGGQLGGPVRISSWSWV